MENNVISPGRMIMEDIFAPLTTPISALDFKDKVKITIKSNAGIKCLRIPKPCKMMSVSRGRVIVPKACDVLKSSLASLTTLVHGAKPKPCVTMSSSTVSDADMMEKGRRPNTMVDESARNKNEPMLCVQIQNKDQSFESNKAKSMETEQSQIKCKTEAVDLSYTQYTSIHIKEEPLTVNTALNIKVEPEGDREDKSIKEEPISAEEDPTQMIRIKEEPISAEEDLTQMIRIKEEPIPAEEDPTQMIRIKEEPIPAEEDPTQMIRIKEEPISMKVESDTEDQTNHIKEECDSPRAGDPSTRSKMCSSAHQEDRIRHRTLPLVIRNPWLTERKMAVPKELKSSILKTLLELDTPSNNAQKTKTLTCTPIKMYKCSKCRRYFTNRLRLKRHNLAHKKYKVACPDCGKLYACKSTMLRHQVVHSKEKIFACSICDKSFTSDKGREIHERRHTCDKPFGCSDCGKRFLYKAQLKTHQMIHTGERYSCLECGRCYRTKPGLVLHMRIHSGDFLYWCHECRKGFVQKSNLKNHLHIHSKEKPFTCLECGKGFGQKYNLKQHMNVHATKECEKYLCPECGKSYKRKADYRWHMLIHLGEK